jgi:hypothetical protein
LTVGPPIKPTSRRCLSAWQPNLGRRSTYRRGDSVQTTETTSLYRGDDADTPLRTEWLVDAAGSPRAIWYPGMGDSWSDPAKMAKFYNARGEIVVTDSDVCPPGHSVRANVMILDGLDDTQREIARSYSRSRLVDAYGNTASVGHRPGHVYDAGADDRCDQAYDDMTTRLSDAWRSPHAAAAPEPPTQSRTDTRDARDFAYDNMVAKISSAWRGASR